MRLCKTFVWAAAAVLALGSGAIAQTGKGTTADELSLTEPVAVTTDSQFQLAVNLGAWFTMVDGTVGLPDLDVPVSADTRELITNLDFAFFGGVELAMNRWVVGLNGVYTALSFDAQTPGGLPADVENDLGAMVLTLGYTVIDGKTVFGSPVTVTPFVGLQWTYLNLDISVPGVGSGSESTNLYDPIFGGRMVFGLAPKLDWRIEGYLGGFGVDSQLTWYAGTYIDWAFSRRVALNLGYRGLYWDVPDQGGVNLDFTLQGPWVGITIF